MTARRLLMVSTLYVAPPVLAVGTLTDLDVWWHLRAGQWIVEHRAVPWTDPFSAYAAGQPWIAYSWLFEVLLHAIHSVSGLLGLVLLPSLLSLGIVAGLHALVRRARPGFAVEIGITGLGVAALLPLLIQPRPWLFSILFLIVELNLLLAFRESGDGRPLLLLPPIFALWANVHIQFVYGLALLALALVDGLVERWRLPPLPGRRGRVQPLVVTGMAALLATLATPYQVHLYRPVLDAMRLTAPFRYISELQAMAFRSPGDWIVLAFGLAAAFAIGWRRETGVLPIASLALACGVAFRAQRDVWLLIVVAAPILAAAARDGEKATPFAPSKGQVVTTVLVVGLLLTLILPWRASRSRLDARLAETLPVAAASVIEQRGYPGPLFNDYNWGGYLMWRLPHLRVSLDGRNTLHGDARVWRSVRAWSGLDGWQSDPELAAARLVVAETRFPLTALLRRDDRFQVAYEDRLAVVFVARVPVERATP